jgi:hypothetical protein
MALSAITDNERGNIVATVRKSKKYEDTQISSRLTETSSAIGFKQSCKRVRRTQGTSTFK